MRIRLVLASLIVELFLTACVTVSGAQQADKTFANDDEFRNWFAFYYRDPHPEFLTSALQFMSHHGYLDEGTEDRRDTSIIASVFLAHVFVANPNQLATWTADWGKLGQKEWYVVLVGLWMSDLPEAKELVRANLSHVNEDHRARLTKMLMNNPSEVDPLTAEVIDPRQINLLWAAFSATGDERYVRRVISYVHLYGENAEEQSVIGEAAIMTLANNTLQHESVARLCSDANSNDPDPKTRVLLKAMLNAVAQMVKEGRNPSQPAH